MINEGNREQRERRARQSGRDKRPSHRVDNEFEGIIGSAIEDAVSQYHNMLRQGLDLEIKRIVNDYEESTSHVDMNVGRRVRSRLVDLINEEVRRVFDNTLTDAEQSFVDPIWVRASNRLWAREKQEEPSRQSSRGRSRNPWYGVGNSKGYTPYDTVPRHGDMLRYLQENEEAPRDESPSNHEAVENQPREVQESPAQPEASHPEDTHVDAEEKALALLPEEPQETDLAVIDEAEDISEVEVEELVNAEEAENDPQEIAPSPANFWILPSSQPQPEMPLEVFDSVEEFEEEDAEDEEEYFEVLEEPDVEIAESIQESLDQEQPENVEEQSEEEQEEDAEDFQVEEFDEDLDEYFEDLEEDEELFFDDVADEQAWDSEEPESTDNVSDEDETESVEETEELPEEDEFADDSDDLIEIVDEDDDLNEETANQLFEGTVRLNVEANGCIKEIVQFVRELRQKPELRLLRLVGNNKEGVDIWLGLREPLRIQTIIPKIDGVSIVCKPLPSIGSPDERLLSVRMTPLQNTDENAEWLDESEPEAAIAASSSN